MTARATRRNPTQAQITAHVSSQATRVRRLIGHRRRSCIGAEFLGARQLHLASANGPARPRGLVDGRVETTNSSATIRPATGVHALPCLPCWPALLARPAGRWRSSPFTSSFPSHCPRPRNPIPDAFVHALTRPLWGDSRQYAGSPSVWRRLTAASKALDLSFHSIVCCFPLAVLAAGASRRRHAVACPPQAPTRRLAHRCPFLSLKHPVQPRQGRQFELQRHSSRTCAVASADRRRPLCTPEPRRVSAADPMPSPCPWLSPCPSPCPSCPSPSPSPSPATATAC
jgi:hypothetical protein